MKGDNGNILILDFGHGVVDELVAEPPTAWGRVRPDNRAFEVVSSLSLI